MESSNKAERAHSILEKVNFWIGNGDAKVSFLISFTGVFLGFIFASDSISNSLQKSLRTLDNPLISDFNTVIFSFFEILIFLFAIFFITQSIFNQLKALQARINPDVYSQPELETNSSIFWGTIGKTDYTTYKSNPNFSSDDKFLNDLQSQIYINSKICSEKFSNYNKGIRNLKIGIIAFIVFKIFTYIPF